MQSIVSIIIVGSFIASIFTLARKKSAGNHMSEGIVGILFGVALLTKANFLAIYLGKWILDWNLILGIGCILTGAVELFQGVVGANRQRK